MSRWRTAGGGDDSEVVAGDRSFLRWSERLESNQLGDGDVYVSRNGRMDRGSWQPRRGIANVSGVLEVNGDPLRLPFFLVDTPGGLTVSSAARVDEVVTLTFASHPFTVGLSGYLGVESLTGTVDPNGVRYVTIDSSTTVTFSIAGASGNETYGGTGKVRSVIDDSDAAEILASCVFSDPSSLSDESVMIAANGVAYRVSTADGTVTEVAYPLGSTISGECSMLQAFDRVFLHRDGLQSWEWFAAGRAVSAAALSANVVTVTLKNHGLTVGDSVVLASIGFVTTNPNGTRVVTGIPTADTFTFALTAANETFTAGTGTASAGFTKCPAGAYTQPQVFEVTSTAVSVVSGLVTLTVSGNTTIATDDTIRLFGTDVAEWLPFVGRSLKAVSASSTAISFYLAVPDTADISTDYVSVGKEVSVGGGLRHMPAPPWSVYFQRRLCCPFWYSQTGTTASPVFTDRGVRDEIVISDILDPHTFDSIENQFRVTAGIADFTVALWPFYEDRLMIFNRNSLHVVTGISGALSDTTTKELTREIGCVARRSIAQQGTNVLFLSDSGVYAVEFLDEYNLRGVDLPLSDPIQPTIDRINRELASKSIGIYFSNRYYLAVPLDSAVGAGDATGNNAILVFNFQNKGWESVDSVDDTEWSVIGLHIAQAGSRNDLYAVNSRGGVHRLDSEDDGFDSVAVIPGGSLSPVPVSSLLVTRQYDNDSLDRKRFTELQIQAEASSVPADATLSVTTEDPDSTLSLGSLSSRLGGALPSGEEASIRARIGGSRGHGILATITPASGRPKIKSVRILGTQANRSTTTVQ